MPAEYIERDDSLNTGREKLNDAIDAANKAEVVSANADGKATEALAKSESTQTQLDTVVIEGDSSVEAAQARVKADGTTFPVLRDRLNDSDAQLAQNGLQITDLQQIKADQSFVETGLDSKATVLHQSKTVNIPSDFDSIQIAINNLTGYRVTSNKQIILNLEEGYKISEPIVLSDGDYSHFKIVSTTGEVHLDQSFPKMAFLRLDNARGPRISTLFNGGGYCSNGIVLMQNSQICIDDNCGFTHAGTSNLYVGEGSTAYARNSIFTYGSQDGTADETGGSGVVAWGGTAFIEGANVSFSNTYGVQAAHSGRVSFRQGIAKDCGRYGARTTNSGLMDLRNAIIENAGYFGLYLFGAGLVNARAVTVKGCATGVVVQQASSLDARDSLIEENNVNVLVSSVSSANFGGATIRNSAANNVNVSRNGMFDCFGGSIENAGEHGVSATSGGIANVYGSRVQGSSGLDLRIEHGSTINARTTRTSSSISASPVLSDTNALAFNSIENSFGIIWG